MRQTGCSEISYRYYTCSAIFSLFGPIEFTILTKEHQPGNWVKETLTNLSHRIDQVESQKKHQDSHFMSLIANSEVQLRLSPIRYSLLIKMAWNSHYKGSMWESMMHPMFEPKYHRVKDWGKIHILCLIDGDWHNTNVFCQIYYARESIKG